MLKFKERQTYICEDSFSNKFIVGNEYKVKYDEFSDKYVIYDEEGVSHFDFELNESTLIFKLKEE